VTLNFPAGYLECCILGAKFEIRVLKLKLENKIKQRKENGKQKRKG
jgi:hypothetical protein